MKENSKKKSYRNCKRDIEYFLFFKIHCTDKMASVTRGIVKFSAYCGVTVVGLDLIYQKYQCHKNNYTEIDYFSTARKGLSTCLIGAPYSSYVFMELVNRNLILQKFSSVPLKRLVIFVYPLVAFGTIIGVDKFQIFKCESLTSINEHFARVNERREKLLEEMGWEIVQFPQPKE